MMASLPSGVIATACGGPAIVCSTPSTTAVILGGNWDASITARLSEGAGCGYVEARSTRTYLPSFADTIRSAALDSWGHRAPATRRAAEVCDRKSFMCVSWLQSAGLRGIWASSTGPLLDRSSSHSHLRTPPTDRGLHDEGHQAAGRKTGRQEQHRRDRAPGDVADPWHDILGDEAAEIAHRVDGSKPRRRRRAGQELRGQAPQHRLGREHARGCDAQKRELHSIAGNIDAQHQA